MYGTLRPNAKWLDSNKQPAGAGHNAAMSNWWVWLPVVLRLCKCCLLSYPTVECLATPKV